MMKHYLKACMPLLILAYPLENFAQSPAPGMEPGTGYREYTITIPLNSQQWRVTDPNCLYPDRVTKWLPNPVFEIPGISLDGAVRAELTIDFWSGHRGTLDKKIRLNDRKRWTPLNEELTGTETDPWHYLAQYNVTVPVSLSDLIEGTNTVQGTCGDNLRGWGQWGWYALTLRIYLEINPQDYPNMKILQVPRSDPSALPEFYLTGNTEGIRAVDFLAAYEGVDEDGDGDFKDYHGMYRFGEWTGHVGSTQEPTKAVVWNTEWIPDQRNPVKVIARVQKENGEWFVLDPLDGVQLNERDYSVQIFHPKNRPVFFEVRANKINSCILQLPLDFDIMEITDARMFLRTWNAENNEQKHTPFRINHGVWQKNITGPGHQFHMEYYTVPIHDLRDGPNLFTFHSTTVHHGCEFLWPGPQLLLKFNKPDAD